MSYLNDRSRFGPTSDKGEMLPGNVLIGGNHQCAKLAPNYSPSFRDEQLSRRLEKLKAERERAGFRV